MLTSTRVHRSVRRKREKRSLLSWFCGLLQSGELLTCGLRYGSSRQLDYCGNCHVYFWSGVQFGNRNTHFLDKFAIDIPLFVCWFPKECIISVLWREYKWYGYISSNLSVQASLMGKGAHYGRLERWFVLQRPPRFLNPPQPVHFGFSAKIGGLSNAMCTRAERISYVMTIAPCIFLSRCFRLY